MRRKLTIAGAVLLAFVAAASAQQVAAADQARPRLKSEAVVTGDLVRIGDLIENAGIVADVPIFRSPDLGSTGSVPAEAVIEAVRAHAIVGLDPGDVESVVVTRATRTIDADEIRQIIAEALAARYSLGSPDDIAVTLERTPQPVHVEPSLTQDLHVGQLTYDARSTRFHASVTVPGRRALWLAGHAQPMADVVTLARPLARGDVIQASDLTIERRPRRRVARDVIAEADEAVGLAARNNLQAGSLLHAADLMKPELVRRNEAVTLVYQAPGISLTMRGKAVDSGAHGDSISVLNEQSRRTVQGVIVGPGRVLVSTRNPRLAANIPPGR